MQELKVIPPEPCIGRSTASRIMQLIPLARPEAPYLELTAQANHYQRGANFSGVA